MLLGLLHGLLVGLLHVLLSGLLLGLLHSLLCGKRVGLRGGLLCGLMWGLLRGLRCVLVVNLLVGLRLDLLRTCCVVGSRGSGEGALLGAADGYVWARCGWAWARPTGALIVAAATRVAPVSGRLCWLLEIGLGLRDRRGVLFGEHVSVVGCVCGCRCYSSCRRDRGRRSCRRLRGRRWGASLRSGL
jgi:hypothetical protein